MSGDEHWFIRWEIHRWFDRLWKNGNKKDGEHREELYCKLAEELGIPREQCHFATMEKELLDKALVIVKKWWFEKYDI